MRELRQGARPELVPHAPESQSRVPSALKRAGKQKAKRSGLLKQLSAEAPPARKPSKGRRGSPFTALQVVKRQEARG